MTLTDVCAQWHSEEQLYGSDVCQAFWLYCHQRREEGRFWRLWQERYGRPPTPGEARRIKTWIAMQTLYIST
mgnify:CR=1 FL=1